MCIACLSSSSGIIEQAALSATDTARRCQQYSKQLGCTGARNVKCLVKCMLLLLCKAACHSWKLLIARVMQYWDDMSDQYRQAEGSLLPLWKFYTERCKHKHVTSLCWNPQYNDLFAVGYGSFDFLHQSSGLVCCYSLKNPSYPEYVFGTDSGNAHELCMSAGIQCTFAESKQPPDQNCHLHCHLNCHLHVTAHAHPYCFFSSMFTHMYQVANAAYRVTCFAACP